MPSLKIGEDRLPHYQVPPANCKKDHVSRTFILADLYLHTVVDYAMLLHSSFTKMRSEAVSS
jgi:hypothetical protein